MKSGDLYNGFTLSELMVGLFFMTLAATAIIIGSFHAKKTMGDVRLKQLAYEELRSYTEFWKGKIAAGDIPSSLSSCSENICLKEEMTDECTATGSCSCIYYANELCYELNQPPIGNSNASRYELITRIKWDNISQIERELSFNVIQMVF